MKLRLEKNSIRYRLGKADLARLKQNGFVEEIVTFPAAILKYELRVVRQDELSAAIANNSVIINIPRDMANTFFNPDEVGIYRSLAVKNAKTLDIIIEKDFPCKDRPGEDRSDKFSELAEKEETDEVC